MIEAHHTVTYTGQCSFCGASLTNGLKLSSPEAVEQVARNRGWLIRKKDFRPNTTLIYCSPACREEHLTAMAEAAYEG